MKKKLKNVKKSLSKKLSNAKKHLDLGQKLVALMLMFSSFMYLAMRAPEVHNSYIRAEVGSKVFKIQAKLDGGGGTGFAVKAPSGKSYIMTNDHVCAIAGADENLLVINDKGEYIPRRILERSGFSDICILEGLPGVEGLELGSEPVIGDTLEVVGHPRLRPLSLSKGEYVGKTDVPILDHIEPTGNPFLDFILNAKSGSCDKPKNDLVALPIEDLGLLLKVCFVVTRDAFMTTAVIYPGNSGSPVVNFWGHVVGIAFASDNTNWAFVVSRSDIERALSKY